MSVEAAVTEPMESLLLSLDEDLLLEIARGLLARDLRAALRLQHVCKLTRARLDAVRAAAVARQLQWQPELSCRAEISVGGTIGCFIKG